jgi:DNA-binding transcriptional ArsR family regulator
MKYVAGIICQALCYCQARYSLRMSHRLMNNPATESKPESWTFLSNHTHVLVCLSADGNLTVRDIAFKVGITERAVLRILAELEAANVLRRERDGRRNTYQINFAAPLRHALEAHCTIGTLLALFAKPEK